MKNKKVITKKLISSVLVASLAVTCFTGCGKSKKTTDSILNDASQNSKDYVFKSETITVDGVDPNNISDMRVVGDRVYMLEYSDGEKKNIYSMNPDGTDVSSYSIPEGENESFTNVAFDKDGNLYGILYVYPEGYYDDYEDGEYPEGEDITEEEAEGMSEEAGKEYSEEASSESSYDESAENEEYDDCGDDADTDASLEEYDPSEDGDEGMGDEDSEETVFLVKYDNTGKEVYKHILGDDVSSDDYFNVYGLAYSENNGLILSSSKGIEKYDESTGFTLINDGKDKNGDVTAYSIYNGFDGSIFLTSYGEYGLELRTLDLSTGKVSDASSSISNYGDYSFFAGNGYDIYVSSGEAVFGYDKSKDELVKLMDYVDSDLEVSYSISSIVALSDAEFVAALPDVDYNFTLEHLTKVPADQVKDKKIITVAGNYIDSDVRKNAVAFNKTSDEYRIKLVDYSVYDTEDNWNAGYEKLNLDIASGNVPDVMLLDEDTPIDSYANKGLFLDLAPYLEKDEDIKDVEFVQNILDALKNGEKQYTICSSFYFLTLVTRTDYCKGKDILTIEDCINLINEKGAGYDYAFGVETKSDFLQMGMAFAGNNFIDWKNKKCSFNSDEFISFLEFSNNFPAEYADGVWEGYNDSIYRTGEALFAFAYISEFRDFARYKDGMFGADISFIGYPNNTGENFSVIYPRMRFAISANSKAKDGAWDFVKTFLTEEYQDNLEYSLPIRKSSFEKAAAKSMEKPYYMDEGNKVYYDDSYYIDGEEVILNPLTTEDVKYIEDFVYGLKYVFGYNESMFNIVVEESSAYFSGQKSSKEVADIIQSRLSIYVNENS